DKKTAEPQKTNAISATANSALASKSGEPKKRGEAPKAIEVVFAFESDHVKMIPVKRGISDDAYVEITEGLKEDQEIVSGGYKAINRELEEGKKVKKGVVVADTGKEENK